MTAPISQRLRCVFSGHDWRMAIGPRDGYFERCRRCYSTRIVDEQSQNAHQAATFKRVA
ncbi:MAG: hypothetical protein ACRDKV_00350 [Solirubrobacterales bacterium]